jgi:hypothetical protein
MTARCRGLVTAASALTVALLPGVAAACATCVSSAYGDRTFNWAYGGLLLAPFVVAVVVAAVLSWNAGYRLRWRRSRRPPLADPIPANEERP